MTAKIMAVAQVGWRCVRRILLYLLVSGGVAFAAPLHDAARTGSLNRVQQIVDQGADVNAATSNGWTPLMEAAKQGEMEIAQFQSDWVDYSSFFSGVKKPGQARIHQVVSPQFLRGFLFPI